VIPTYHLFAFRTEKHPEEYIINIWTVEDGLPQNTIQSLVQTHDGFIWIGTPSGLVRFDGLNFKIYTRWNLPALKSDNITCLYEDQNNVFWVGTEDGGLCALQDGKWINYSRVNGLSSDYVRGIISDQQGNLWVATDYGLNRINNNGIQIYTEKDGLYDNTISSLAVDSWNNLWIGTFRGGLAKYNREITAVYGYKEGLRNLSVRTLLADPRGFLWIGTAEGMYYIKRDEGLVHPVRGTDYTPINTIIEKTFDYLWLGTMVGGLKQMKIDDLTRGAVTDLLPDDFIHCLLKDNAGNIWIGTDTGGLVQLKIRRIFNITEKQGLPDNVVSAVYQDRSNTIWIGTRDKGLVRIRDKNKFRVFNKNDRLSSNRISVIFEDKQGQLWIGTRDQGLNIFINNVIRKKLTTEDGLSSNYITTILQDHTGTMWIGTEIGLNRYSNGEFSVLSRATNPINPEINVLLESQHKILYAGTNEGVYKLSNNSLVPLKQTSNIDYEVASLYEDQSGSLWIGTNGDGLFRWYNNKIDKITKENGLLDNFILSIHEDEKSNLCMSSHSGIFMVKQRDLLSLFDKKNTRIPSIWFNESEGMASRQCVAEGQPSVFKTEDNQWLYPTTMGVAVIDPQNLVDYCTIPKIKIEHVFCGDDTISMKENINPELDGEMISISFSATEFAAPSKLRFNYRLEGYDEKVRYINPGSNRKVIYHNLSPGDHTFNIWGVNNEGKWGEHAATFSFRIKPPFYLNPLFLILFIGISLSISSSLIYYNHRRKKQKQKDKYKTSSLDPNKIDDLTRQLDDLMAKEKLFLDPDLTLRDLSVRLKIHYNSISRIINEHFQMSYNDFINKYRIEEIKKRFADPDYMNKTVLEIMYETGFYSKSVFNTAFKKFTGMTPSEYRKKVK
jgi:ligand-binding sensor domain-containing protein/AraC-like DNA-binding protein